MADGEILCYADSAYVFLRSMAPLVEVMRRTDTDVMAFRLLVQIERVWTKRDAFVLMDCDAARYADTHQADASLSLWRKSASSMAFAREWLRLARDARLVTDAPNGCGLENYPGFREHRHDQSIFSLLCKQRGVPLHRQPSRDLHPEFPHSHYPRVVAARMSTVRRLLALPGQMALRDGRAGAYWRIAVAMAAAVRRGRL